MKKLILLSILLIPNLALASYLESANFLAEKEIIVNQGQAPENYNLEKNILRQEIAGTIAKIAEIPEKTICENKFLDVKITPNNSWACLRIESLLDAGLIAQNKNYNPENFVSKAEALGFILKGLYKEEYEIYTKNNQNNSWEINAINFAKEKAILDEEINNYTDKASRGFIFNIIAKAIKIKENLLQVGFINIDLININDLKLKNDLFIEINKFRKENNLEPLIISEPLNKAAQKHSEDLSKNNYFSHVSLDGKTPGNRVELEGYNLQRLLENIARGQDNAKQVVNEWIASPGHKKNMLDSQSIEIGIGFESKGNYWVINIGREFN